MTCPNQSTTVTIPYPTGTATVVPVDSVTCNPIDPTKVTVVAGPLGTLGPTTSPAVTADASGLHFSANAAAFGTVVSMTLTFTPNAKFWTMTATVGGPVTPVGTTSTP